MAAGSTDDTLIVEESSWRSLLLELQNHIPELADASVARLQSEPWYSKYRMSADDIRDTVSATYRVYVSRLLSLPEPEGFPDLLQRLAARRVQQGVPLPAFLRAVRLDFRVMLDQLQTLASATGGVLAAEHVTSLLDAVEDHIDELRDAYQRATGEMDVDSEEYRGQIIARLFDENTLSENDIDFIASRLGLRTHVKYEVIAVVGDGITSVTRRYGADERVYIYPSVNAVVLFREQSARGKWRRQAGGRGGYVDDVQGLAGVPEAARVALEIARHVPAKPILFATERDIWPIATRKHVTTLFPRFSAEVRNQLQELPEVDRKHIVECTVEYLRTGSVKLTSERLYCHRNTVIKRLKSFSDATGFDPTVPRDAAWLTIVLSA